MEIGTIDGSHREADFGSKLERTDTFHLSQWLCSPAPSPPPNPEYLSKSRASSNSSEKFPSLVRLTFGSFSLLGTSTLLHNLPQMIALSWFFPLFTHCTDSDRIIKMNKTRLSSLGYLHLRGRQKQNKDDHILGARELCIEYCWFMEATHPNKSEEAEKISQEDGVYLFFPELYLKKVQKLTR